MSWISVLLVIVACGLVLWLVIDTIIWLVKKIKAKKLQDSNKDKSNE